LEERKKNENSLNMLNQKDILEIKKISQEFFGKTSLEIEVEILLLEDKTVPIKIKTEEPKLLIGQNGKTLNEIQHLLKAILKRKIPEDFYISLDINDYKKKKTEYLKETAKSLADQVSLTKQEKILAFMPAYERRIVHLELAERPDVTTESIGREPERRIIVKPIRQAFE